MKKILEVLLYGENDVRFNTDFDPAKSPEAVQDLLFKVTYAMLTRLWGGNETAVLAMIRLLAIADLSVSVNRKDMIRLLDNQSKAMANAMKDAIEMMKRSGADVKTFGPGIMPSKIKS